MCDNHAVFTWVIVGASRRGLCCVGPRTAIGVLTVPFFEEDAGPTGNEKSLIICDFTNSGPTTPRFGCKTANRKPSQPLEVGWEVIHAVRVQEEEDLSPTVGAGLGRSPRTPERAYGRAKCA